MKGSAVKNINFCIECVTPHPPKNTSSNMYIHMYMHMVCSLARQTFFEYKKTEHLAHETTRCAGIHACPYDCLRGQGLGHKSVRVWGAGIRTVCVHGVVTGSGVGRCMYSMVP